MQTPSSALSYHQNLGMNAPPNQDLTSNNILSSRMFSSIPDPTSSSTSNNSYFNNFPLPSNSSDPMNRNTNKDYFMNNRYGGVENYNSPITVQGQMDNLYSRPMNSISQQHALSRRGISTDASMGAQNAFATASPRLFSQPPPNSTGAPHMIKGSHQTQPPRRPLLRTGPGPIRGSTAASPYNSNSMSPFQPFQEKRSDVFTPIERFQRPASNNGYYDPGNMKPDQPGFHSPEIYSLPPGMAGLTGGNNPYILPPGSSTVSQNLGLMGSTSNVPDQLVNDLGVALVQKMSNVQLSGELVQPKWCNYPHTSDTLLPKDRALCRTGHNLFFEQPHMAVLNNEKDLHKMLINRFRQMTLKVEGGNQPELLSLNDNRYLDLNAMENVGIILSSSAPIRRQLISKSNSHVKEISVDSHSLQSTHDGWHSVTGGAHRSICFRGYDIFEERLVHIRLLLDDASETFSNCNVRSSQFGEILQKHLVLKHKGLCIVKDVFKCHVLQQNCLAMVCDYQPSCVNLLTSHMNDNSKLKKYQALLQMDPAALNKQYLDDIVMMKVERAWDYLVQLTGLLRCLHSNGLAYGLMDPSKVLIQEGKRLLLGSVGAWEMLNYFSQEKTVLSVDRRKKQMKQDLSDLGRLMVAVNFGVISAYISLFHSSNGPDGSLEESLASPVRYCKLHPNVIKCLQNNYGDAYCQLIQSLVEGNVNSIELLMPRLAPHAFSYLEDTITYVHFLESYSLKEALNGRLFRLLTKLNMCCYRSQPMVEDESSEVLILRLFLDFVFHQQLLSGHPMIDLAHVITCLTKLEGNSTDRISLISHTGHAMVVSYSDVLSMLSKEFNRLKQAFQQGVMEEAALQSSTGMPAMH